MKKFVVFAGVILSFVLLLLWTAEKTDVFGLGEREIAAAFHPAEKGRRLRLIWEPWPYPCYYKVETFSRTTGLVPGSEDYHIVGSEYTLAADYEVPTSAIPMYYRVTAYGMFGPLGGASAIIPNPLYHHPPVPQHISHYPQDHPASLMPFLIWHTVPTAVCYEVEILAAPPDKEGGTELSKTGHLAATRQVFTNGWQADLRPYREREYIYWRVRALGLHHEPIGEFSRAEALHVAANIKIPDSPLLNDFDRMPNFTQPIYPVFSWIPLNGERRYEVELMVHPPAKENNSLPTPDRVWQQTVEGVSSCYDEYARPYAGEYYWRVRAVDKDGDTVGSYSDTAKFTVEPIKERPLAAVFGDSITHGGGALSYSPSDLEYSYVTYLDFPALNLGRSGDTSATTAERFAADVLPIRPQNLLILTGSNSLRASYISAADIIGDLEYIKSQCETNDIRPIFLTLLPLNPENILYAFHTETDPKWAAKLRIVNTYIKSLPYHIDLEPYFYDRTKSVMDTSFAIDGLHPDIRGKMLMAEIINKHQNVLRLKK